MANGNVLFTDPVVAQQMVQLAQIQQAEEAERQRALLGLNQVMGQQRVARENSALDRARLQSNSDIQRAQMEQQREQQRAIMAQQASEGGLNRAARASELDRTLAAEKELAASDAIGRGRAADLARSEAAMTEAYNRLLDLVQSDDPPTDAEFSALAGGITGDRSNYLNTLRQNRRIQMNDAAGNAETMASYWNNQLKKLKPDDTVTTIDTVVTGASKSPAGKFIIFDPSLGQFVSMVRRPRQDAVAATGRNIEDVINRVRGAGGRQPLSPPTPVPVTGATVTPQAPPGMEMTVPQIQSPPGMLVAPPNALPAPPYW